MTHSAGDLISDLLSFGNPERKQKNEYFFKTGKGQYAEGDIFAGVCMPDVRLVAKRHLSLSLTELSKTISHEIHEVRLCSLVILVLKYKGGDLEYKKSIVEFYLLNKAHINNWDLVDVSAHYVIGQAFLDGIVDREVLWKLAQSEVLWDRRIAMVSTWIMIRSGDTDTTISLARELLDSPEDLMHKAIGWMLREAWKIHPQKIESFLVDNYANLPRTTLRYAIERMEPVYRGKFLKGEF